MSGPRFLAFSHFRLDLVDRVLEKDGRPIPLTPKEFDTLCCLVQRHGRVVTKEHLAEQVWPGTFVGDSSITRNISVIRKALNWGFIETIPKRGYRFTEPVSEISQLACDEIIQGPWDAEFGRTVGDPAGCPPRQRPDLRYAGLLFAALALAGAVGMPTVRRSRSEAVRSLLVVSAPQPAGDLEADILASGAAESVIYSLRRARNLQVVAEHTPAMRQEAAQLGRRRGTDAVLLMQTDHRGDRLHLKVGLMKSATGVLLWEEAVTGQVTEAAWVDAEVADVVARRVTASPRDPQPRIASSTAFQHYLRGRYFWNKRTPDALEQAFAAFRQAIQQDPNFALAYAGLAQTYAVAELHDFRYRAREETYQEARAAAKHAIALDPQLAAAHLALAQILRNYDRDMARAESEYQKALALDPGDPTAHQWYAEFLSFNGRHSEAIAEIDRARQLDPLSAVVTAVSGSIRMGARRYAEAMPFHEEALRLDPHYYPVYGNMAGCLEQQGRYTEAFAALKKMAEISGAGAAEAREDEVAFERGGVELLKKRRVNRVFSHPATTPGEHYAVAYAYCTLGKSERCLQSLEQAVAERSETVIDVKINPAFDIVRGHARYAAILRKFGFTPDPTPATHAN